MQGKILAYDAGAQAGVIKGDDSQPYYFTHDQWLSTKMNPAENLRVMFEPKFRLACMVMAVSP